MVFFLSIVTIALFGACNTEDDLLQQSVSDRTPISFRVEGGTTRATFINSGNFNSLVKTLNVSAFTSDGKVYIKTVQLKNDGNGNFAFPNSDDVYYWPEKNTKLTFVAWAGDNISVDDAGNVSYTIENDNSKQLDQLFCKTSALSSTDCPNGKVSLDLGHAYAAIEFKAGKKFTPETVTFDGITFDVAAGAGFIKPGKYNTWVKGTPLPSDKSTYFHIKGKWKSGEYSHSIERICALPKELMNAQAGKIYQVSIANEDTIGYDSIQGKPVPVVPSGAVDLGLSVFWASCNLGASKPEEYGKYYQWADTKGHTDTETYNYNNQAPYATSISPNWSWSKYNSQTDTLTLDKSDDAASVNLGGSWRMPTVKEMEELQSKCKWTWIIYNDCDCYKVVGPTGNYILLPAGGYYSDQLYQRAQIHYTEPIDYYTGVFGYYWSSQLYNDIKHPFCLSIFSGDNGTPDDQRHQDDDLRDWRLSDPHPDSHSISNSSKLRYFGLNIRPVHP